MAAGKLEAKLRALRDNPTKDVVRDALRSTTGILVAAAAKLADAHGLVDELAPAFERLLEQPVKRDPSCRGKVAIARVLHELDRWEDAVFARGVAHVQEEGGVDTAAALRGLCGLAHAQFGRADALDILAALLADPERNARIGAAQGLGDSGHIDTTALLRYKILVGDDEGEVLTTCFESLFALTPERAIEFAAGFLDNHDDRAEIAAIALGTSHAAEAFPLIARWCEGCSPPQRGRVGYLALALMRHEPATELLLDVIRTGAPTDAVAAGTALATFKDDPVLAARIAEAARAQPDRDARDKLAALTS